jgi:hypothetical protein
MQGRDARRRKVRRDSGSSGELKKSRVEKTFDTLDTADKRSDTVFNLAKKAAIVVAGIAALFGGTVVLSAAREN